MGSLDVLDAATPRFEGEFLISHVAEQNSDNNEAAYIAAIGRVMDLFARDLEEDTSESDVLKREIQKSRDRALSDLREEAVKTSRDETSLVQAAQDAFVIRGTYLCERNQLLRSLFVVSAYESGIPELISDVTIHINKGLAGPGSAPTLEQQHLYVAMNATTTTISAVAAQSAKRPLLGKDEALPLSVRRMVHDYMGKLMGIAKVGFELNQTAFAQIALDGLKLDFYTHSAARVKNGYMRRLALPCAAFSVVCLIAAVFINANVGNYPVLAGLRPFFLLAAGGAVGTWLSFAVRGISFTFEQLALPDEDLLEPSVRVIFVVLLTTLVGLFFSTGVMQIEIGNLKTESFDGEIAILIGSFCGLSERALASSVSARAASFVKGLGGA